MTFDEKEKIAVLGALNAALQLIADAHHAKYAWNDVTQSLNQIRAIRDTIQKTEAAKENK